MLKDKVTNKTKYDKKYDNFILIFPLYVGLNIPRATTRDCPYVICHFCRGNPLWLPLLGDGIEAYLAQVFS